MGELLLVGDMSAAAVVRAFLSDLEGAEPDECIVEYLAGALTQDEEDVKENLSDLEDMLVSMCPAFSNVTDRLAKLVDLLTKVCDVAACMIAW